MLHIQSEITITSSDFIALFFLYISVFCYVFVNTEYFFGWFWAFQNWKGCLIFCSFYTTEKAGGIHWELPWHKAEFNSMTVYSQVKTKGVCDGYKLTKLRASSFVESKRRKPWCSNIETQFFFFFKQYYSIHFSLTVKTYSPISQFIL